MGVPNESYALCGDLRAERGVAVCIRAPVCLSAAGHECLFDGCFDVQSCGGKHWDGAVLRPDEELDFCAAEDHAFCSRVLKPVNDPLIGLS